MGTRLDQFDFLLAGYVDPATGLVGAGYTAYFYEAGTTTAKNVYTAYDMTGGAVTSVVLDSTGSAAVWGAGIYKVVIKNLSAATVDTFDGVKVLYPGYNVTTTTAATLSVTTDMDAVLCDPTSTNQVITLPLAAQALRPIFFKRIASGSNTITIAAQSGETIDGAASTSLASLNSDVSIISDGANWYGQAAATTNADTLSGYSIGSVENTIPLRGTDGYISGAEPDATDSVLGVVELATLAEVQTGTDAARVPTVSTLRNGLRVNGTLAASTSGSQVLFGSIPAWVKAIDIMLVDVSLSGTDGLTVVIGDAGGIETTGYVSTNSTLAAGTATSRLTTAFLVASAAAGAAAGNKFTGIVSLRLVDAATFLWAMTSNIALENADRTYVGAGYKSLSETLTQVAVDSNGTDTFDGGSVNISYW